MADTAHTPTPWKVADEYIFDRHRNEIATTTTSGLSFEEDEANAAHIVKCVNAHDDLVEALETLRSDCQTPIDMYERNGPEFTSPHGNEYESTSYVMDKFAELVASIDAALAKARGAS